MAITLNLLLAHGGYMDGFHHWNGGGDGGWGLAMVVGIVLFWAAVIGLIAWLVLRGRGPSSTRRTTPLEVLDRRFAEDSISADDYAERRRILMAAGSARGEDPNQGGGT